MDLTDYISFRRRREFSHVPSGEYLLASISCNSETSDVKVFELKRPESIPVQNFSTGQRFSIVNTSDETYALIKKTPEENLTSSFIDDSGTRMYSMGDYRGLEAYAIPRRQGDQPPEYYRNSKERYQDMIQIGNNTYGITKLSPILGEAMVDGCLVTKTGHLTL
jgi:hypothetical protein